MTSFLNSKFIIKENKSEEYLIFESLKYIRVSYILISGLNE